MFPPFSFFVRNAIAQDVAAPVTSLCIITNDDVMRPPRGTT